VVLLFYIEEHTQKEVAQYLGIPKTTVNNRLHSARKILKRRMLNMVEDTLKSSRLPDDFADNIGRIVSVQGRIVEAQVKSGRGPLLFDNWAPAGRMAAAGPLFTVIQRNVRGHVRLICSSESTSVRVGSKIEAKPEESHPMSLDDFLADAVAALLPRKGGTSKVVESGIKMIDLMSPLPARGAVGLFGLQGLGRAMLVMELYHRLQKTRGKLAVLYFVSREEAANLKAMIDREPNFPPDADGPLETAWLVTSHATDPEHTDTGGLPDSSICFSPLISCRDLYPAIDCLLSSSKLLQSKTVGKDHVRVVERIRDLLRECRRINYDPKFYEYVAVGAYTRAREHYKSRLEADRSELASEDRVLLSRARKVELFLTQPFYTAESYTNLPGKTVSLKETIDGCRQILDGAVDDIPEEYFGYSGTLEEVKSRRK
jgi:hypothetical protein